MFWTRRGRERREPVLASGSLFDLKLDARDRAAGPPQTSRTNGPGAKPPSPRRRKPRRGKRRPLTLRRVFYWCFVLGIWCAVAAGGVREGGSTLTQQLAKNLFLTQERTVSRKIDEVIIALALEKEFSKNQILELYLNRVYFGSGAYGVEAAAQRYFGKSARVVTLAEAAMLAGLVQNAARLGPDPQPQGGGKRPPPAPTAVGAAENLAASGAP